VLEVQTATYPLADYLAMLDREEISINRDYQRSKGIWSTPARSFLVETVLKNFPIPKLSLHHRTDLATLAPHREVVDGQQRTYALRDFLDGKFRLSNRIDTEEWRGKRFEDLSRMDQRQFLNYGLNFDLLVGAEEEEVREIFRRMNTFTVALNYEEQRNAAFNGRFKWFIRDLGQEYTDQLLTAGVLKDRQLLRMADAKLLAEICHAYFYGITTTNSRSLDKAYREHDKEFPEEKELDKRLRKGLDFALRFSRFHEGPLFTRTYEFYSFVLAAMHVQTRIPAIKGQIKLGPKVKKLKIAAIEENLALLEGALVAKDEDEDAPAQFQGFVEASDTRTNVKEQRITRVQWFCNAITSELE
jgi:Protein of unknown function DUF262